MPTIRTWVIATAAAFLALPLAHAWARDCERYPSLCAQSAEAKTAEAAARVRRGRAEAQGAHRETNPEAPNRRQPEPCGARANAGPRSPRASTRPRSPRASGGGARAAGRRPFADDHDHRLGGDAAAAAGECRPRGHGQAAGSARIAAAGGAITLPGDDTQTTSEVVSADPRTSPMPPSASSIPTTSTRSTSPRSRSRRRPPGCAICWRRSARSWRPHRPSDSCSFERARRR